MRALVISDIHSNIVAFEAVLKESDGNYDIVLNLGDLVGYGPYPNECVDLAAQICTVSLAGNHDLAALECLPISDFSDRAKRSTNWTKVHLNKKSREYLANLIPSTPCRDLLLSHGGPDDPIWSYVFTKDEAEISFANCDFKVCFIGHTHIPRAFVKSVLIKKSKEQDITSIEVFYGTPGSTFDTHKTSSRFLLNPGSVGFPRDDPDAHNEMKLDRSVARYATFDMETGIWTYKRAEYDMKSTANRMQLAGLRL